MKSIVSAINAMANKVADSPVPNSFLTAHILNLCVALEKLPDVDYDAGTDEPVDTPGDHIPPIDVEASLKDIEEVIAPHIAHAVAMSDAIDDAQRVSPFKHPTPFDEESDVEVTTEEVTTTVVTKSRWNQGELQLIHDVMLPDTAQSRQTLEFLTKKFPSRSEASIRAKLNKMHIFVVKGKLVKGDHYER